MGIIYGFLTRVFLMVVGIALIGVGVSEWKSISGTPMETQARVVSSSPKYSDTGDKSYLISYKYEVDGVEHTNSFTSPTDQVLGSDITVYYDPASPESSFRSIQERGNTALISLLAGAVLFVLGAWWQLQVSLQARRWAAE